MSNDGERAAQKFQVGDIVRLRSGGPLMTVEAFDKYGMYVGEWKYLCKWFDDENKLTEGLFKEPQIELAAR